MKKKRLAILGSTRGSTMLALVSAIQKKELNASIELVLSNLENALILDSAKKEGLPTRFLNPAGLSSEAFDQALSDTLHEAKIDLIILIGYLRQLSKEFISQWKNKIINVRPSLLPAFAGKLDYQVHQAVLDAKLKETGCTIHFVTDKVDEGPILLQMKCLVSPQDSVESLKARVQKLEQIALLEAISLCLADPPAAFEEV